MFRRIYAITQKELIQVTRDRGTLMLVLLLPLIQLMLFATAIHTDIRHIPMVVADQSMSGESRSYLNALVVSSYFDVAAAVSGQAEVIAAIDGGRASLGLVIPPDFATKVKLGRAEVLMLVDGSDSFTTNSAYNTANAVSQAYATSLVWQPANPLNMQLRILYNPDMKDLWFIAPGLIAALLQGQTLALTALAVVREREVGTIEALLVTPIRPAELMLGKTIPNLLIAFANTGSILLLATLVFGVPFEGNLLLFLVLATLFAFTGLGMGLAISVASQSQMQAQQLSMVVNFTAIFLSGFLFPAYALPATLRVISYVFPLTHFLPIARGIMSKGVGLGEMWRESALLTALLVVILFAGSRLFRESLD